MVSSQIVDGEDVLQIWRVDVNILNKQSQTADKVWSSENLICYDLLVGSMDWINLAQDRPSGRLF